MKYYLTQTIYAMTGYRTLRSIISGYFAHYDWYCGEDREDSLRITPLSERWKGYLDTCSVTAIPARNWYSLIGHGVHVRIINDKRQFQRSSACAIPPSVRALFPGIPNRIEVDSHYRFLSDADLVARTLALKVVDGTGRNERLILLDVDDEATRVKTNPLLGPEERFADLARHASNYLSITAEPAKVKRQLQRATGTAWGMVSPEGQRFLITGLTLYEEYDAINSMLLDSSPGIVALASALELEMNRRVLIPFREWAAFRAYAPEATGALKPFALAAAPDAVQSIELGRFGFFLRTISEDQGASAQAFSQAFTAFCEEELTDPIFVLDQLPDLLLHVARNFRNPAAHTQLIGFAKFREFLEILLNRSGSGLLQRMLEATRPRAQPT
jgi:hypothetical protein